jgi:hypothetical protein
MNLGSLIYAHDSKSLTSPPLPNSSLGLATVSTTFVGTLDIGDVGVTSEAGSNVAVDLIAIVVDMGADITIAEEGFCVGTISCWSLSPQPTKKISDALMIISDINLDSIMSKFLS